jgi:ribonucleoside-diphosphate reductase beta chain
VSYLSPQLVDEVRHMQFYARFQNEVIADPAAIAEGYGLIAADEQRHLAYGTWFLREAVAANPEMAGVIRDQIRELLPAVAESISPPSEGAWDVLGVEDGALAEFALGALNRRLALIGAPLDG